MPTYNQIYVPPARQQIAWGLEDTTAGTPPTTFQVERCKPSLALMSDMYKPEEYFGTGVSTTDWIEMTHHAELTLQFDVNLSGLCPSAIMSMLGDAANTGSADTVSGTSPYIHTGVGGVKGTRCNTYSFPYQTGSGDVLHLTYGTVDSLKVTWAPNNPLKAELKAICFFPDADAVMPTVTQPPKLDRVTSYAGVFNLQSSAGTAYASKVLSGGLTMTRNSKVTFSTSSGTQQPLDIIPGELTLTLDSIDLFYDGITSGHPYYDFLHKTAFGTSSSPNTLKWTDASAQSLEIDFWPAKWNTDVKFAETDNSLRIQGGIETYQDYTTVTGTPGALTAPSKIVVSNDVAGAYIV
ncbi:MAG: hypothetical protein ACRDFS_11730 [Chloroflexota bacterium]